MYMPCIYIYAYHIISYHSISYHIMYMHHSIYHVHVPNHISCTISYIMYHIIDNISHTFIIPYSIKNILCTHFFSAESARSVAVSATPPACPQAATSNSAKPGEATTALQSGYTMI